MIENTLGSLASVMGIVMIGTGFLKGMLPEGLQRPRLIALILGEAMTLAGWKSGLIALDGVGGGPWGYAMASLYALFAVATAFAAYETGKKPEKLVKKATR